MLLLLKENRDDHKYLILAEGTQNLASFWVVKLIVRIVNIIDRHLKQRFRQISLVSTEVLVSREFDGTLSDLKRATDVTTVGGNLSSNQLDGFLLKDFNAFESWLKNFLNLVTVVGLVDHSRVTDATLNLDVKALWEVHSVRNSNDQESWVLVTGPVK